MDIHHSFRITSCVLSFQLSTSKRSNPMNISRRQLRHCRFEYSPGAYSRETGIEDRPIVMVTVEMLWIDAAVARDLAKT